MKKYLKLFSLFLLLLLTGCNKEVITKCEFTSDQSTSGYIINTKYIIYSNKKLVNKVVTEQEITSENNTVLNYYEKQLKELYKNNNDNYGGYSYTITNKNGKIVSKTTMDYDKINLKKYIIDNPAMKNYLNKKNQVTLKGIIKMYKLTGAKCEK